MIAVAPIRASTPRPIKPAPITPTAQSATNLSSLARRPPKSLSSDPLSDKTTAILIRRTLCPQQTGDDKTPAPIEDLLPPLTSRNDVDLQLYAIISIILRDFVQSWYSKITPDQTFVAEVVQIIAHCTRALEQRLRKVDLESLLFDEIPDLLDRHISAYRASRNAVSRPPTAVDPREVYHSLHPLPHLSPVPKPDQPDTIKEQEENEAVYRQLLVQGVLAILLPTEDLENPCLTALVGQIFSELIIGNVVARKLSQPWFLWTVLTNAAAASSKKPDDAKPGSGASSSGGSRHSAAGPSSRPHRRGLSTQQTKATAHGWSVNYLYIMLLNWMFQAATIVRMFVSTIAMSFSLPPRSRPDQAAPAHDESAGKVPVLQFKLWHCIGNWIELSVRMPWLHGALSLLHFGAAKGYKQPAGLDGAFDRLLSHAIHTHVLDPSILAPLLRTVRGTLFPNNAQGTTPPPVPPATPEEFGAVRQKCASAIVALLPAWVGTTYFASPGSACISPNSPSSSHHPPQPTALPRTDPAHSPAPSASGRIGPRGSVRLAADTAVEALHDTLASISPDHRRHAQDSHAGSQAPPSSQPSSGGVSRARNSTRHNPSSSSDIGELRTHSPSEVRSNDDSTSDARHKSTASSLDNTLASTADSTAAWQAAAQDDVARNLLDVFADEYCNRHLMYGVLELVLVRLMPELGQRGITELWEERGA